MFIFLISYRARPPQEFRRNEIIRMIHNIDIYFGKYGIEYKIVIAEQYNDDKFNRGVLMNAAFQISQNILPNWATYVHFNIDYEFNLDIEFPPEMRYFTTGFMELFKPPLDGLLGSACLFDGNSYIKCNGFPNDLHGWGGDDWAIYNRIVDAQIPIHQTRLLNSGFIHEFDQHHIRDQTNNFYNMQLAKRKDANTNGLSTCVFHIVGNGEFHTNRNVHHYLITSPHCKNINYE